MTPNTTTTPPIVVPDTAREMEEADAFMRSIKVGRTPVCEIAEKFSPLEVELWLLCRRQLKSEFANLFATSNSKIAECR